MSGPTRHVFVFVAGMLACFTVFLNVMWQLAAWQKAGRPVSAIATSSSHIAETANVSANGASSGSQAQLRFKNPADRTAQPALCLPLQLRPDSAPFTPTS